MIPRPDPAAVSVALQIYIFFHHGEVEVFLCFQAGYCHTRGYRTADLSTPVLVQSRTVTMKLGVF